VCAAGWGCSPLRATKSAVGGQGENASGPSRRRSLIPSQGVGGWVFRERASLPDRSPNRALLVKIHERCWRLPVIARSRRGLMPDKQEKNRARGGGKGGQKDKGHKSASEQVKNRARRPSLDPRSDRSMGFPRPIPRARPGANAAVWSRRSGPAPRRGSRSRASTQGQLDGAGLVSEPNPGAFAASREPSREKRGLG